MSLGWLVPRVKALWQQVGEQLPPALLEKAEVSLLCVEADEQWGFVGDKDYPVWLWLAVERRKGLMARFHLGGAEHGGGEGPVAEHSAEATGKGTGLYRWARSLRGGV